MLGEEAGIIPATDGTAADTLQKMRGWGVARSVLLPVATSVNQTKSINEFARGLFDIAGFESFAALHPLSDTALSELAEIKASGFRGIKLHPEYQGFNIADERFFPIYDYAEKEGLIIVIHSGYDVAYPDTRRAAPKAIRRVVDAFPRLKLVAAHMGGMEMWEDVLRYLAGTLVYFDTGCVAKYIDLAIYKKLVYRHSPERVLFASDLPWSTPEIEAGTLLKLSLPQDVLELIFEKNAERLLGR